MIVKAKINQGKEFAQLLKMTLPELFIKKLGINFDDLMVFLFESKKNLFSHEHAYFMLKEKKIAGFILSYDYSHKKIEDLRTGILMMKRLGLIKFLMLIPFFLKLLASTGTLELNEYYISNIAVKPDFQGMGFGTKLLKFAQRLAGKDKLVLDVETENKNAVRLYTKIGYKIIKESKAESINFLRMKKTQ
jgi:ribosomal protein S18 acetylase RimI-like enzyme